MSNSSASKVAGELVAKWQKANSIVTEMRFWMTARHSLIQFIRKALRLRDRETEQRIRKELQCPGCCSSIAFCSDCTRKIEQRVWGEAMREANQQSGRWDAKQAHAEPGKNYMQACYDLSRRFRRLETLEDK